MPPNFFSWIVSLVLANWLADFRVHAAKDSTAAFFINLLGDSTFPEGIHTLPDGNLMVGGFGDGSLQLVDLSAGLDASVVTYYKEPGEDGLVIAVGMAVDERRDRLWVANFNFNVTGEGIPGSQIKVFELSTGNLTATIPQDESFMIGSFFNELAINDDGDVFITDTFNPFIWKAPMDLSTVEIFVNDTILSNPDPMQPFDLNGLAITSDKEYLIASVMDRLDAGDGRLVSINLSTQQVANVALMGDAVDSFAGSDGMFFDDGYLFMVNVYSRSGAIITATFNEDYTEAILVIRDAGQPAYDRPTASAISNGKLWTVNSQLDHIIDDNNGVLNTPPSIPFQIVGVEIDAILKNDHGETTSTYVPTTVTNPSGVRFIDLLGNSTFPEGIHTLPDGNLMVSGFGDGSLQLVDLSAGLDASVVTYYKEPGEDGLVIAVGMAVDERRDRLWVANFNFDVTGEGVPGSQIKVFELSTGNLSATIPRDESFVIGSFFNELAIDDDGDVFITDTFNPFIWKVPMDLSTVEIFVNDTLLSNPDPMQPFDLNGLAITSDNEYLIASVMDRLDAGDGRLVRINLST